MPQKPLASAGLARGDTRHSLPPPRGPTSPAPYRDPSLPIDARVSDLLGRMTLEEKVAQLQGFVAKDPHAFDDQGNYVGGADAAALAKGAGSVYAMPPGATADRFAGSPIDRIKRGNAIQKFMREKTRLGIPGSRLSAEWRSTGTWPRARRAFPRPLPWGAHGIQRSSRRCSARQRWRRVPGGRARCSPRCSTLPATPDGAASRNATARTLTSSRGSAWRQCSASRAAEKRSMVSTSP